MNNDRELIVFAGQSNMMGAAVFPPRHIPQLSQSMEYKHKTRRLGLEKGTFSTNPFPVGEFSYADIASAYGSDSNASTLSTLAEYAKNTWFCPAMSNLGLDNHTLPFSTFSEKTFHNSPALPPYFAEEWEKMGHSLAYACISKGSTKISYYFTQEMAEEYSQRIDRYNAANGTAYPRDLEQSPLSLGAASYFTQKCQDFFVDAKAYFPEANLTAKCLVWLQGESNYRQSAQEYYVMLDVFWKHAKKLGFTHFCMLRVPFFGDPRIVNIMLAQERFCLDNPDVYMITRAASFFSYPGRDETHWFVRQQDVFHECRDSAYGFQNHHINEKGFRLLAERTAKNLHRILYESQDPILEKENISALQDSQN